MKATTELAAEVGWNQLTMRRLADKLGWQAASIYEYFPGKEEILAAIIAAGYQRLLVRIQDERPPTVSGVAQRVWAFAWENPQVYQAMNGLGGVPYGWDWRQPDAKAIFAVARSAIDRDVGPESGLDLDAATDIIWSLVHGVIALAMAGRIAGSRARSSRLLDLGVHAVISGWRTQPDRRRSRP